MAELLALDVVRDPVSELGGQLDRYASALTARFDDFGAVERQASPSLLRDLANRWTLPQTGAGLIEVFDGRDFSGLMRHWGSREGYLDEGYRFDSPFVIPVDPVEHVQGITGERIRRPADPRRAMRPVAVRSPRPTVRPRARERWRPVEGDPSRAQFSAYPPGMGRAGAIDATLLRFPTATAEARDGLDRAVVVDDVFAPRDWAPSGASVAPAASAAEQLTDVIGARLAPERAVALDAWLVPASAPASLLEAAQGSSVARLGRRPDARIPLRAFTPRIGEGPAPIGRLADESAPRDGQWAQAPRVLVTPGEGDPAVEPASTDLAPRVSAPADRGAASAATAAAGVPAPSGAATGAATAPAIGQRAFRPMTSDAPPSAAAASWEPSNLAPWRAPHSAPPGRELFVPAALAQLARQVGANVRPSDAPDAEWPWAPPPVREAAQRRAFDFARQADEGVLLQAVAEPTRPSMGMPAQRERIAEGAPALRDAQQDRPPGRQPIAPPDQQAASLGAPARPTAIQRPALEQPLAAPSARLVDAPPGDRSPADPVAAGLDALLGNAPEAGAYATWQRQAATSAELAQAIVRLDRLQSRATVGLLGGADRPEVPSGRAAIGTATAGFVQPLETRLVDGLSVLTGAPASAALFADAWGAAPAMVRAVLSAVGFGPGAAARPGPAFSFGERLAAVAADLSARHGLTTAGRAEGALDAPWFREPTGTLVVPMAATPDEAPDAVQRAMGDHRQIQRMDRARTGAPPASGARETTNRSEPLRAPLVEPAPGRSPLAALRGVDRPVAARALRAALRGSRRLTGERPIVDGPRLRPIPRLQRLAAPIAPRAMSLLAAIQAAPPALVGILARAEQLLAAGAAPEAAVSALARAADLSSLVTLARLADAPDAVEALSDPARAPAVLRALQRAVSIEAHAERRALNLPVMSDPQLVTPIGEPPGADPVSSAIRGPAEAAIDVQARQVLAAATSALPAAIRAALEVARRAAPEPTAARPIGARVEDRPMATIGQTGERILATQRGDLRAPGAVDAATASPAMHAEPRSVGATARRLVEWAQAAEAATSGRFDALAITSGDATQSPIARRIITPGWGQALDATLLSPAGRPEVTEPRRATPIGRMGRRSEALTGRVDGLGPAAEDAGRAADAPWALRAAWLPAMVAGFAAAHADPGGLAAGEAAGLMPIAGGAGRRTPEAYPDAASQGAWVVPGVAGDAMAPTAARRQVADAAAPRRGATTPGETQRPPQAALPAIVPGLQAGRYQWPRVALEWVQAAARAQASEAQHVERGLRAVGAPADRARVTPGSRSLESLALSSRLLVKGLDGLGLLDPREARAAGANATSPLGALATTAPVMQLDLGLPGAEGPALVTEGFAERTMARQVPLSAPRDQVAAAPRSTRFDLDVDWVQPMQAVDRADADLAPRLRSPSNIRRAIGVWVDAVKAEAERSPAAARQALGSVGQLIEQLRPPSATRPTVRPSNVLRGPVFQAAPVMLEAPEAGEARPALIRPGEQAAKQALRKGNNETMQVSGGAQTVEESRHKNAEQTDELMPPEEVERLASEVIDRIKRELEFDLARTGEDGWD